MNFDSDDLILDLDTLRVVKRIGENVDYIVIEDKSDFDYIVIIDGDSLNDLTNNCCKVLCNEDGINNTTIGDTVKQNQVTKEKSYYQHLNELNLEIGNLKHWSVDTELEWKGVRFQKKRIRKSVRKPKRLRNYCWDKSRKVYGPPFHCDKCDSVFEVFQEYKKHRLEAKHHLFILPEGPPYKCCLCGKEYDNVKSIKRHTWMFHGKKKYSCTVCDKRFRSNTQLKNHLAKHTRIRKYECDVCSKKFLYRCNLMSHKITHDEKQFVCAFCGAAFHLKVVLKAHEKMHEKKEQIIKLLGETNDKVRKICPAIYPRKCRKCSLVLPSRKEMLKHTKAKHPKRNINL